MAGIFSRSAAALRRLLHLLGRPVRRDRGRGGTVIHPYRGYGAREEIFLMGRVFRQTERASGGKSGLGRDLVDVGRRLLRRGVPGVLVTARFGGAEQQVKTDRDGYFRLHLRPVRPPPAERLWHTMEIACPCEKGETARAEGEFFVPPAAARFVVISDIDDTVMFTGVASKIRMLWRLFLQGAESRLAFPGVGALYRALHDGSQGGGRNPLLYVSRGPWTIYEMLDEFFQLHRIPVGPILFLRDWGVTLRRPFPRQAKGHKLALVRQMLALYGDLPFVLIGDSGQHDPEVYAQVVRENPGRVLAIYIRNVSRDRKRQRQIEELACEVVAAGSTLLLAADSFAMAEHAAEQGLIAAGALPLVMAERRRQEGEAGRQPTREVKRQTAAETGRAVEKGEVAEALAKNPGKTPPNVKVEAEEAKRKRPRP